MATTILSLDDAADPAHLEATGRLMRRFVAWQWERHAAYRALIDRYFDPVEFDAEGAGGRQHGGAGRDVAALAGWREDHERVGHAAGFLGARRPS